MTSCLLSQTTFFSSAILSLKKLLLATPLLVEVLCDVIEYPYKKRTLLLHPSTASSAKDEADSLSYLPVKADDTAARTILSQFQALGIVPSILIGSIRPLTALGAGKMNNGSYVAFFGHILLDNAGNTARAYCSASFSDGET